MVDAAHGAQDVLDADALGQEERQEQGGHEQDGDERHGADRARCRPWTAGGPPAACCGGRGRAPRRTGRTGRCPRPTAGCVSSRPPHWLLETAGRGVASPSPASSTAVSTIEASQPSSSQRRATGRRWLPSMAAMTSSALAASAAVATRPSPEATTRKARASWPAASMMAIMRSALLRQVPAESPVTSESTDHRQPDPPDLILRVEPHQEEAHVLGDDAPAGIEEDPLEEQPADDHQDGGDDDGGDAAAEAAEEVVAQPADDPDLGDRAARPRSSSCRVVIDAT